MHLGEKNRKMYYGKVEALPEQPAASAPCFLHEASCRERGWKCCGVELNPGLTPARFELPLLSPSRCRAEPSRAEPESGRLGSARLGIGSAQELSRVWEKTGVLRTKEGGWGGKLTLAAEVIR